MVNQDYTHKNPPQEINHFNEYSSTSATANIHISNLREDFNVKKNIYDENYEKKQKEFEGKTETIFNKEQTFMNEEKISKKSMTKVLKGNLFIMKN